MSWIAIFLRLFRGLHRGFFLTGDVWSCLVVDCVGNISSLNHMIMINSDIDIDNAAVVLLSLALHCF